MIQSLADRETESESDEDDDEDAEGGGMAEIISLAKKCLELLEERTEPGEQVEQTDRPDEKADE